MLDNHSLMAVGIVQDLNLKTIIWSIFDICKRIGQGQQSLSFSLIIKKILVIILLATSFSPVAVTYECQSENSSMYQLSFNYAAAAANHAWFYGALQICHWFWEVEDLFEYCGAICSGQMRKNIPFYLTNEELVFEWEIPRT